MARIAKCPIDGALVPVSDGVLPDYCPNHDIPLLNVVQGPPYPQEIIDEMTGNKKTRSKPVRIQ